MTGESIITQTGRDRRNVTLSDFTPNFSRVQIFLLSIRHCRWHVNKRLEFFVTTFDTSSWEVWSTVLQSIAPSLLRRFRETEVVTFWIQYGRTRGRSELFSVVTPKRNQESVFCHCRSLWFVLRETYSLTEESLRQRVDVSPCYRGTG